MRLPALILLAVPSLVVGAQYPGVGRDATPAEVSAWDIDVRPDFTGLPAGKGSVADGEKLWTDRCSSCHGDFGEANHVFTPLVGSTTAADIQSGRVASLKTGGSVRTTFAKVSTVSTLWDYIHRAMPWNAPKSLSNDQVYAVLAYLLNLAEIVPADFVLSDQNIADVQARMPNRNGVTREHGLWDIRGKPDTHNVACMKSCKPDARILSELPDFARNAHGNLADQNRTYGPVRGQVTDPKAAAAAQAAAAPTVPALVGTAGCTTCHAIDRRIVGPAFAEVSARYRERPDARAYLVGRILKGGTGTWGGIPMPPQPQLGDDDAAAIADWIVAGAKP